MVAWEIKGQSFSRHSSPPLSFFIPPVVPATCLLARPALPICLFVFTCLVFPCLAPCCRPGDLPHSALYLPLSLFFFLSPRLPDFSSFSLLLSLSSFHSYYFSFFPFPFVSFPIVSFPFSHSQTASLSPAPVPLPSHSYPTTHSHSRYHSNSHSYTKHLHTLRSIHSVSHIQTPAYPTSICNPTKMTATTTTFTSVTQMPTFQPFTAS